MKQRLLATILSTVMVTGMLAGCGTATQGTAETTEKSETVTSATAENSTTEEATTASDVDPQIAKTIKILSIWDKDSDNGALITKLCDQYKAEVNPNFDYEYEYVSSDDLKTKISTLAASNDLPDIFAYESGKPLTEYINAKKVVDISDVLKKYNCESSLNESAVSLLKTLSGTDDIYDLPLGLNVEGFWYNKAAFEKAGITDVPATWDQFEEDCQKLQAAGIQPIAAGGSDKWGVTRLINAYLVRTAGADAMKKAYDGETKYTDQKYVDAAGKIQEWATKGWFGKGVNTVDMTTAGTMLMNGQAGIFYNGSWFTQNLNDASANKAGTDGIGFFNVPVSDASVSGTDSYSMNCGNILAFSQDKYDDATGWFIKYFVENMGNIAMETQGTVKGYNYSVDSSKVTGYTQLVLDELGKAKSAFTWYEATMDSQTSTVAQEQVQSLLTGDITPQDYMQAIQDAHDMNAE